MWLLKFCGHGCKGKWWNGDGKSYVGLHSLCMTSYEIHQKKKKFPSLCFFFISWPSPYLIYSVWQLLYHRHVEFQNYNNSCNTLEKVDARESQVCREKIYVSLVSLSSGLFLQITTQI